MRTIKRIQPLFSICCLSIVFCSSHFSCSDSSKKLVFRAMDSCFVQIPFSSEALLASYSKGYFGFSHLMGDSIAFISKASGSVYRFRKPNNPGTDHCSGNMNEPFWFDGHDGFYLVDGGWTFVGQVKENKFIHHVYLHPGLGGTNKSVNLDGATFSFVKIAMVGNDLLIPFEISPFMMDRATFKNQPSAAYFETKLWKASFLGIFNQKWFGEKLCNRKAAGYYIGADSLNKCLFVGEEFSPKFYKVDYSGIIKDSTKGIPDSLKTEIDFVPKRHLNKMKHPIQVYHKPDFKGVYMVNSNRSLISVRENGTGAFSVFIFDYNLKFVSKTDLPPEICDFIGFDSSEESFCFLSSNSKSGKVKCVFFKLIAM